MSKSPEQSLLVTTFFTMVLKMAKGLGLSASDTQDLFSKKHIEEGYKIIDSNENHEYRGLRL